MPTLRIDCIDSATLAIGPNGTGNVVTPAGATVPSWGLSRVGDFDYVINASNNIWGSRLSIIQTFQDTNLSFLDNSQIQSMRYSFYVGTVIYASDVVIYSMGQRITPSTVSVTNQYWATGSRTARSGSLASGTLVTLTISSLADLKRMVAYGVMIRAANVYPNITENCSIYSFRSATQYRPYITVDYVSDSTLPPILSNPNPDGIIVNSNIPNVFSWTYSQALNASQNAFDIQVYTNSWQALVTGVSSSNWYYNVPSNRLTENMTMWRVRARSTANVWSGWVTANIVVREFPAVPNITDAPGVPKPTFVWQSNVQTGFKLRILDENNEEIFSTSEIASTLKRYQYPGHLPDGTYTVQVMVVNSYGDWSEWGSAGFSVTNTQIGTITLTSRTTNLNTVALSWTTTTNVYSGFYVLRNGRAIAELPTTARTYEDCNANGKNTYIVRGVFNPNPNYSNSNPATETICICNAQISLFDTKDIIRLTRRRGARPVHSIASESFVQYQQYEGRDLPVAYRTGGKNIVHNFQFTFKCKEEYDKIKEMDNKTVVYKDCKGYRVVGNFQMGEVTHETSVDFDFTIVEIDVGEYIEYA